MKYVSLFSGIEAATVAWHPLGWEPLAYSEIEPFPCALLAYRYPGVPNRGDMTKVEWAEYRGADLLVGGSPCQAFSVSGLRESLADPRGQLTLQYVRAIFSVWPRYAVWENVASEAAESFTDGGGWPADIAPCLDCSWGDRSPGSRNQEWDSGKGGWYVPMLSHTLKAAGADASEDGTGRGSPIVQYEEKLRRLSPLEWERLQGFPDGYTAVPFGRKLVAPDSPRYKAIGNAMPVPVMRWIGERIAAYEEANGAPSSAPVQHCPTAIAGLPGGSLRSG